MARNLLFDADRAARSRPVTVPEQPGENSGPDTMLDQVLDRETLAGALQELSSCWSSTPTPAGGPIAGTFQAAETMTSDDTAHAPAGLTIEVYTTPGRPFASAATPEGPGDLPTLVPIELQFMIEQSRQRRP